MFSKIAIKKSRLILRIEGSRLKQGDTTPFPPNNAVNIFVVNELDKQSEKLN